MASRHAYNRSVLVKLDELIDLCEQRDREDLVKMLREVQGRFEAEPIKYQDTEE